MSTNTQPLLTTPSASPAAPHTPEAVRLLRVWVDLANRASAASAHGNDDENSIRDMQVQVEQALIERLFITQAQLDAMTWWESTLTHLIPDEPATACASCRKTHLGLPANLPLPRNMRRPR